MKYALGHLSKIESVLLLKNLVYIFKLYVLHIVLNVKRAVLHTEQISLNWKFVELI